MEPVLCSLKIPIISSVMLHPHLSLRQDRPQRWFQRRIVKNVSPGERFRRIDPLARGHECAQLTQRQIQRKARHGKPGRSVEDSSEQLAETIHRYSLGSHNIDMAGDVRLREQPLDQTDMIMAMDPRYPLSSRHNRTAGKESKRQ